MNKEQKKKPTTPPQKHCTWFVLELHHDHILMLLQTVISVEKSGRSLYMRAYQ